MGVASLVIGIISLVVGFVPFCGTWAMIPAVVGLILGIVDAAMKSGRKQPKGMSIAGVVLNSLAMLIIVVWWVLALSAAKQASVDFTNAMQQTGFTASGAPAQPQQQTPSGIPMQPMQPVQPIPSQPAPPSPTQ